MKNDSVKFKRNVPKSSTNSDISPFSCSLEQSPLPNGYSYQNFTHAQSISARLSRSSIINDQNIRYSNPHCKYKLSVEQIMNDEVLAKSPLNRNPTTPLSFNNPSNFSEATHYSRFTRDTQKRIRKIQELIQDNMNQYQQPETENKVRNTKHFFKMQDFMEDEVLSNNTNSDKEQSKQQGKIFKLLEELRILRKVKQQLKIQNKDPKYFETFDGKYALHHTWQQNFKSFQNQFNGIVVNNGRNLQSIVLVEDTFKVEEICRVYQFVFNKRYLKNPQQIDYSAFCLPDQHFNEQIITGSEDGHILTWSLVNHQFYKQYVLQNDLVQKINSKPTFMTQHLQNLYVGTQDYKLLIYDQRIKEKQTIHIDLITQSFQPKQFSFQSPTLQKKLTHQFSLDSPKESKGTVFTLIPSIIEMEEDQELNTPLFIPTVDRSGVRYIDAIDNNVVVTMENGFVHFDIRQSKEATSSFIDNSVDPIKTLFSPESSENVIMADRNSHYLKMWNCSQNHMIFERDMLEAPIDMIISPLTKEVLTLIQKDNTNYINIYENDKCRLKYVDQLSMDNFPLQRILLDCQCSSLYAIGNLSLRTWNFYNPIEISKITKTITKEIKQLSKQNKKQQQPEQNDDNGCLD